MKIQDTSSLPGLCRAEDEMPFVRKPPWPKSPTVSLQKLRRSWILVFYFSIQVPLTEASQQFFSSSGSSSLEICQDSAGEMGILRSIWSFYTERLEYPERLATRFWFIRNCTRGRVPPWRLILCSLSPQTANFYLRCRWAFWFPTKLWLSNVEKRSNGQRKRDLIPEWGFDGWGDGSRGQLVGYVCPIGRVCQDMTFLVFRERVVFLKWWVRTLLF